MPANAFYKIYSWDRCYDFEKYFRQIFGENIGHFAQTTASFKKIIITFV
jgi:hypothetical protein